MDDDMKPSANGPEKTLRWSPVGNQTTDCVLWALSRMLGIDYAMLATWFSVEKSEPNYHANVDAVLTKYGFDLIETTLEDRGKLRFVEAYDETAELNDDGSREGHVWYVDEDERVWGLGPDRSVSWDSVHAKKFIEKKKLHIERVLLIRRKAQ